MPITLTLEAPIVRWLRRFPKALDHRVTHLLDLNNDGKLTPTERKELEGLVSVLQLLSLLKSKAEASISATDSQKTAASRSGTRRRPV